MFLCFIFCFSEMRISGRELKYKGAGFMHPLFLVNFRVSKATPRDMLALRFSRASKATQMATSCPDVAIHHFFSILVT